MDRPRVPLSLHADRCDRCGRCVEACEHGALKVGVNYIFVDWRTCDGCLACVRACERGAIEERGVARRPAAAADAEDADGRRASDSDSPRSLRSLRNSPKARRPSAGSGGTARPTGITESPSGAPAWSLLEAWTMLVVLFALFLGKDAVLTSAAVLELSSEAVVFARVGVLFSFYLVQMLVLWMLALRRGVRVLDGFRLRVVTASLRERVGSVALVIGLLVAVRLGAWAYGVLVQVFGWDPPVREITDLTEIFGPTVWGLLLSVALVVVVAPVVEEVVFRGVLQGAFVGEWGAKVGIVVSAALFALYHLTAWLFLPLFALGVACGWLAHTRRSLLPAIALHAAYNVVPVVISFYLVW